jgi:hypothetical protein
MRSVKRSVSPKRTRTKRSRTRKAKSSTKKKTRTAKSKRRSRKRRKTRRTKKKSVVQKGGVCNIDRPTNDCTNPFILPYEEYFEGEVKKEKEILSNMRITDIDGLENYSFQYSNSGEEGSIWRSVLPKNDKLIKIPHLKNFENMKGNREWGQVSLCTAHKNICSLLDQWNQQEFKKYIYLKKSLLRLNSNTQHASYFNEIIVSVINTNIKNCKITFCDELCNKASVLVKDFLDSSEYELASNKECQKIRTALEKYKIKDIISQNVLKKKGTNECVIIDWDWD